MRFRGKMVSTHGVERLMAAWFPLARSEKGRDGSGVSGPIWL